MISKSHCQHSEMGNIRGSYKTTRANKMRAYDKLPPEVRRFRCVDCGKDTIDEYYMVADELWAASGGGDGMLCLACLERRIGRKLALDDFTAMVPSPQVWKQHLARRARRGKLKR